MKNIFCPAIVFILSLNAASLRAQKLSIPYQQFKLKNGLNVILHQDKTLPRVSVNVWYHVGSGSEKVGRTGFAHLFEHLLFEGSKNVPDGKFTQWLEAAGGGLNGSTSNDRTNYYEDLPSNALELALFLESDRMGFLLETMSDSVVNGQRDVVKNERRESYENQPYGKADLELPGLLYPKGHPYSWTTIGSMEDLSAARHQDVIDFFNTFYTTSNASLCVAGDIDYDKTRQLVEKWFNDVPAGSAPSRPTVVPARLAGRKVSVLEDDVQLPRLMMVWLTPGYFQPGDGELDILASVLSQGKNSRLYKKLVYELQIAQDVQAYQSSQHLNSEFYINVDAREGTTLAQIEQVIWEELDAIKKEAPPVREVERAVNKLETLNLHRLESTSDKADLLNQFYYFTGNPDYMNESVQRYGAVDGTDISAVARKYLDREACLIMSVVPNGKTELAAKP